MSKRNFQSSPLTWKQVDEGLRKVSRVVNDLLRGKLNNTFEVTLTASATSTVLSSSIISPDSEVFLTPKTATAATAIGAGAVYAVCTAGTCTITHDSTADTDRTFAALIVG